MPFSTIKISKSVYDELNKLRVHRPEPVCIRWIRSGTGMDEVVK